MIRLGNPHSPALRIDADGHVLAAEPITPLNELAIMPEPNSGCWLWTGSQNGNGYGQIACSVNGRSCHRKAHRVVYETHFGPIPIGMDLDHLCRTRCCVNPAHLEPVTRSENIRRGLNPEATRARFAAKTHCVNGHSFTPENVFVDTRGHRQCRECTKAARARYYRKSRSAAQ